MKIIISEMLTSLKCIEKYSESVLAHIQHLTAAYKAQLEKNAVDHETGLYEYLDRQGVMDYLGISLRSYYRFLSQGILKPQRIGGRDYFLKKDLNEAIAEGSLGAGNFRRET